MASTEAGLRRTAAAGLTPSADAAPPGARAHGPAAAARRELHALLRELVRHVVARMGAHLPLDQVRGRGRGRAEA